MLTVVFFAASWINRRFMAERAQPLRLIVGVNTRAAPLDFLPLARGFWCLSWHPPITRNEI